ncbi:MAG: cob(I)yrinic acid a,c-diamide adenosyltransferase [Paludibacteraceae bacterium]
MSVYTKTGDRGDTSLANMERVSKSSLRLEAYGTADELNAFVGVLRAHGVPAVDGQLLWVQHKLFNAGAALSLAPGLWIDESDVEQIEHWIDEMQNELPPQRCFILPAGNEQVAYAHICRTTTRRLERDIVRLQASEAVVPDTCAESVLLSFVNRLSDYFFVLARYMAHLNHILDTSWQR